MNHRAKWTPKKAERFLERIAAGWAVSGAARASGLARQRVYEHLATDAAFKAAYEDALEQGTDVLEDAARQRAVDGVQRERGIYFRGTCIDTYVETEYSDTLLIFLLKARRPEKFTDTVRLNVILRQEAARLAEQLGCTVEELIDEAQAIANGRA